MMLKKPWIIELELAENPGRPSLFWPGSRHEAGPDTALICPIGRLATAMNGAVQRTHHFNL